MLFLNDEQLDRMRDVEERSMPDTGVIERVTLTPTGMGGYSEQWVAVGTVPCDAWPMSMRGQEIITGGQVTSKMGWFVSVPYSTDVLANDRMTIDDRTFEIVAVPNSASWQTNLQLECTTLNQEKRD